MSKIEQSVDVNVPVREAYNQWTQFEEFPEFMKGVESVKQTDDTHLHWVARDRRCPQGMGCRDHPAGAGPAHRLEVHHGRRQRRIRSTSIASMTGSPGST